MSAWGRPGCCHTELGLCLCKGSRSKDLSFSGHVGFIAMNQPSPWGHEGARGISSLSNPDVSQPSNLRERALGLCWLPLPPSQGSSFCVWCVCCCCCCSSDRSQSVWNPCPSHRTDSGMSTCDPNETVGFSEASGKGAANPLKNPSLQRDMLGVAGPLQPFFFF